MPLAEPYDLVAGTSAGPFERELELATLAAAVAGVSSGDGGFVRLCAAAGLGKSRLLDATEALAREHGVEVLRAAGGELERELAFGMALQLFEARLRGANPGERARLTEGSARLALALFEPGVASQAPAGPADVPIVHGLYWLAANLAHGRPLVLLVDDVHWADPLSLRFLIYLAQRAGDLPLLLVASWRPREPGADLQLLDQLAHVDSYAALAPRPLSERAVAALLAPWTGADPDGALVAACADVTGGNPLLVRELVHALTAEGTAPTAEAAGRVRELGPAPVSRAIDIVLRRLPASATDLARAVAVLGDDAELIHAAALAGLDTGDAVLAATSLEAAGVFHASGALGFLHPIMRNAVYAQLQPSERSHAHRTAARVIADAAPVDRVASHLVASRPGGDPWAVARLREAAASASARGAPAVAASYLLRALTEPALPDVRPDVLVELGRAEAAAGSDTALDSLSSALEAIGETERAAELQHDIGQLLYSQGRFAESAAAFQHGIDQLGDAATGHLRLELEAGYAAAVLWDPAGGVDGLSRLEEVAAAVAAPQTRGQHAALANLAGAHMMRGEGHARAIELALRAWDDGAFLDRAGPDDPSLPAITGALTPAGAFGRTREIASAALEHARRRGSVFGFATASYLRGCAAYRAGMLDDALADLEAAVATRQYGWEAMLAPALWFLGLTLIERGDLDRAARELGSLDFDVAAPPSPTYAGILHARGCLALARNDAPAALAAFTACGRVRDSMLGTSNPALCAWESGAALALARLGRTDEAQRLADAELAQARRFGAAWTIGVALRARGLVAGREGRPWLEEAVEALEASEARLEFAQALVDLGALLRRSGNRSDARDPLRRGLDLAEQCGALALASRARDELAATGARPRRTRQSGPAALTPSEQRVARMAAQGLTNRQIADALFVTPKAVSFHLGNVYRKLGVSSRELLGATLGDEPRQQSAA